MRVLPVRLPPGHVALAGGVILGLLTPRWPLLVVALPVLALLTGRLSEDPRPAVVVYFSGATAGVSWLLLDDQPLGMWVTGSTLSLFTVLLPWLVGLYLRSTVALEHAGWERARTLERESQLVAERARMRERSRIAQDLHDAVGHELSLLSLRASGLEMASDLTDERRAQAGQLRGAAGRAAERLMEAVGVLRADAEPAPLNPARDSVAALVKRARASGMDVTLIQEGGSQELPVMVDRAIHRVVQEALTNTAKHAPGAALRVVVDKAPHEVRVRVSDTAPRQKPAVTPVPGSGMGLEGLRERVRLAGGVFEAGVDGDGWTVSARIPVLGLADEVRTKGGPSVGEPQDGGASWERHGGTTTEVTLHRRTRRRVGWGIAMVVGIPVIAVLIGYGLVVALTMHQAATATLDPSVFEGLRSGQDRTEVEALLPEGTLYQGLLEQRGRPTGLDGLECAYFRSSADAFGSGYEQYRLCFDAEVLVSAETLVW